MLTTPSEDAVREILLRIDDVATLFRCAATCERWRRLVGKPSFLIRRNRWPPPPSLGFFSQRLGTPGTDSSIQQLTFAPLAGLRVFGTHPHALRSFLRANDVAAAAAIVSAVPLAARGGLLLLRIYARGEDLKHNIVRLAVCNLLAGTWDMLPKLHCISNPYTCAILPSSGPAQTFRVLMIGADRYNAQFNLHAFASSEPSSWRAPTKCFDMMERQIWSVEQEEAVVCRGMVHWLFVSKSNHFHVLNVNAKTGHVSLTKLRNPTKEVLPIVYSNRRPQQAFSANRLTTTACGTQLSLCMYSGRHLEIWTQEQDDGDLMRNDDDAVWIRTTLINHKLTNLFQQLEQPSCIWSGERGRTLLITDYHKERKYIAHLDAGTLKEVTGQFRDIAWSTIMPMEIDWPTFFMLRLGGPPLH
ncbi:unnamed protein product [Alopecurus aequalis]